MLYSYRHPDILGRLTDHTDSFGIPEEQATTLKERRRSVRSIPVPTVIESNDVEAWEHWDRALVMTM
jgi:hypothetical protein